MSVPQRPFGSSNCDHALPYRPLPTIAKHTCYLRVRAQESSAEARTRNKSARRTRNMLQYPFNKGNSKPSASRKSKPFVDNHQNIVKACKRWGEGTIVGLFTNWYRGISVEQAEEMAVKFNQPGGRSANLLYRAVSVPPPTSPRGVGGPRQGGTSRRGEPQRP
jgi:hypothetical protein